jgi:putative DNA methylase
VYLSPSDSHEELAKSAVPKWIPDNPLPVDPRDFKTPNYGLRTFGDLFTTRQLVALSTFSDMVSEAREKVQRDAIEAGVKNDLAPLREGGVGVFGYSEAVAVYLAFVLSKVADRGSALTRWMPNRDSMYNTFSRQCLPMSWDYVEVSAVGQQTGGFAESLRWTAEALEGTASTTLGSATQMDVRRIPSHRAPVFSTDPPYYDNISYANLSDFFYIWLRRVLRNSFPELFGTMTVPKSEELIASPYRHGGKNQAETFFLNGMTEAMHRLAERGHPAFPVTIYYAFKQSESDTNQGTASTGWETFLDAVIRAGFATTGTWPIRTELGNRLIGKGTNALASSIVLVCRPRLAGAPTATRREFVAALKSELPRALLELQAGNIAPVDLAQAAIGPGMAVFTRYSKVIDAEGNPISVREALALINQTLDEALAEQEGDFDADSRWALAWFEQHGFAEGDFGVADVLARAKNTSVSGLVEAGILASSRGKVRLFKPDELPVDWDPATDARLTSWEVVHHLIRVLETAGEAGAAKLMAALGAKAEAARDLCYRLYSLCERKKRANEALAYNGLVQSWPEISRLSREQDQVVEATQVSLF